MAGVSVNSHLFMLHIIVTTKSTHTCILHIYPCRVFVQAAAAKESSNHVCNYLSWTIWNQQNKFNTHSLAHTHTHKPAQTSNWKYHMMMSCNISKRILSFAAVAVAVAVTAIFLVLVFFVFMLHIVCALFFPHLICSFMDLFDFVTLSKTLNGLFLFSISDKINCGCMSALIFIFSFLTLHLDSRENQREYACNFVLVCDDHQPKRKKHCRWNFETFKCHTLALNSFHSIK